MPQSNVKCKAGNYQEKALATSTLTKHMHTRVMHLPVKYGYS